MGGESDLLYAAFYGNGDTAQGQACILGIFQKIQKLSAGRLLILITGDDDTGIL
jgi:hypothetical protein